MKIKIPIVPFIPVCPEELSRFLVDRYNRNIGMIRMALSKLGDGDTLYVIGPGSDGSDLRYLENREYEAYEALKLLYENLCFNLAQVGGSAFVQAPQIITPIYLQGVPYSNINYSDPRFNHQPNDMGYAEMIVKIMNGNLIYILEEQSFYKWNGRIWSKCFDEEIARDIAAICTYEHEQRCGQENFNNRRAIANGNVKNINGIRDALALLLCARSNKAFHDSRNLLCVRNGVINFNSPGFECRLPEPHEWYKQFHLTQMVDVDFIPGSYDPAWDAFISDIMNKDIELASYLQRVFGYALIGDPKEQKFFILIGSGGNGKTTLLGALQSVLGCDFCCSVSPNLFTGSDIINTSAPRPEVFQLKGKRIVFSSELPRDSHLSEAQIKRFVAGGTMYAREPYARCITEFKPEHTIFIDTNYLPGLYEAGYSVERRLGIIPFMNSIKRAACDVDLDKKLIRHPEAILAWLVNGAAMYMQTRLAEPDISKSIIKAYIGAYANGPQYQSENDSISLFVNDRIMTYEHGSISASDLYTAYQSYCTLRSLRIKSKDAFYKGLPKDIKDLRQHMRDGQYFNGITFNG